MQQLINFCPVMGYEKQIANYPNQLKGYLKDNHLDGIELFVYDTQPFPDNYEQETIGVHLKYFPIWLDFWQNKQFNTHESSLAQSYAVQFENREVWLQFIKENILASAASKPKYFVWHISNTRLEEIFTRSYYYSSQQVIQATVEVFNEVSSAIPSDITVFFENLWWPGLTFTEPSLVETLLSGINFKNVGFMLDTGHLMNTNWNLCTEKEAIEYIVKIVNGLGYLKNYIKGMHLSCSLSGEYQRQHVGPMPQELDINKIITHITNIDQHRPFQEASVRPLLDLVQPEYLVHELHYNNMEELAELIKKQYKCL